MRQVPSFRSRNMRRLCRSHPVRNVAAKVEEGSAAVTICGRNISELTEMSIVELSGFMNPPGSDKAAVAYCRPDYPGDPVTSGIFSGCGTGLFNAVPRYPTLSGGEAQRIRLATQIGSGLVGVAYPG